MFVKGFLYKLSIHFDEDETKCILLSKEKYLLELNIIFDNNIVIEFDFIQYIEYHGCYLDTNINGELSGPSVWNKLKKNFKVFKHYHFV